MVIMVPADAAWHEKLNGRVEVLMACCTEDPSVTSVLAHGLNNFDRSEDITAGMFYCLFAINPSWPIDLTGREASTLSGPVPTNATSSARSATQQQLKRMTGSNSARWLRSHPDVCRGSRQPSYR